MTDEEEQQVRRTPVQRLLLTVPEAAEALAIGRTSLYELEVVHIGRSTRVPVDAVHRFVQQQRTRA